MKPVETFTLTGEEAALRGLHPNDANKTAYVACMSCADVIVATCWFADYIRAAGWCLDHSFYIYTS